MICFTVFWQTLLLLLSCEKCFDATIKIYIIFLYVQKILDICFFYIYIVYQYIRRRDFHFGVGQAPFIAAGCPVDTCYATHDRQTVTAEAADAILYHARSSDADLNILPNQEWVLPWLPNQQWVLPNQEWLLAWLANQKWVLAWLANQKLVLTPLCTTPGAAMPVLICCPIRREY